MIAVVKPSNKIMPVKKVRLLRQVNGWRVLLEEGINSEGVFYKRRLDFYNGELRQKLHLENGTLRKTVFVKGHHGTYFYERTFSITPDGRQVIEEGWTGKHGYFSLKMPNGRKFAHFGLFLVEEWNNMKGRIREVKIDKNGEYVLEKRTVRKSKGATPELLEEHPERTKVRYNIAEISARSDLSSQQKWTKIREIITQYREKVM
ncbi:MAG: hypothetical protein II938_03650 [Alphaproteobacteria bacterium]|nr:hypothetical protein [Alphaproteobacteria bacterium]